MQTLLESVSESHIQYHKQVMRIRKNKNLSEMGYEGLHSAYECQLNHFPWDAISFSQETCPSSLNLLQSSDNSHGNWRSAASASARLEKGEGLKETAGGVSDTINSNKQKESGESETETGKKGKFSSGKKENKCVGCQKIEWWDHCCCCVKLKKHEKRVHRRFLATKRLARQPNKLQSSNSTKYGFYFYSGFGQCCAGPTKQHINHLLL